ncbi:MAG: type I glyceraldehyde-3-phosphate dehydrogenase [Pseudomonadota bacterium]
MTLRIGINGFGRIGRLALREMMSDSNTLKKLIGNGDWKCVGINDIVDAKTMAHLFKYDSVHGTFDGEVKAKEGLITINGQEIPVTAEKDPTQLPWKKMECDIVLECTGIFTSKERAAAHLNAGAKKVIISAPAKDKDTPTFVFGVNHTTYNPKEHNVISNASCTTNCLAPVVKVLHDNFGVEQGLMTTIHSYTNDQHIVDAPHKDLRRARAGALSQIPTTTGAARAVGLVLPDLAGKLDGLAIRVPTPNVSLVDLVATLKKPATVDAINAALKKASEGALKHTLAVCEEPLVSVDFMGNPNGSIVDGACTKVIGNIAKVMSWYDNEMGFCYQMLRMANYMGTKF